MHRRDRAAGSGPLRPHLCGGPTIGPRLPALFAAAGLDRVRAVTVENPITTVDEELFLAELVENMREAMLAAGATTASELADIRAGVKRAARDPERTLHQARIHQDWGRRPD